ncbi:MAG: hypothetical protein ABW168_00415 [Sedimenticola sp.]
MRKPLFMTMIVIALSMLFLSTPVLAAEPPGMSPEPAYACTACHEAAPATAVNEGRDDHSYSALNSQPPPIDATTQATHSHSLELNTCPLPHEKHISRWRPGGVNSNAPVAAATG